MNKFSIGILTYNQEDFIIELLESVKFQIDTYGADWKVYLHVVDDCSSDKTPAYIDKWLKVNKSIFADTHFTKNKENHGTVYNHNFLINSIKTNLFKIIAGDDVITSQNLFECCKVNDNTLKVCSCIILKDNQLILNRLSLRLSLYNNLYCKSKRKILNFLAWYNWIVTPQTCYNKSLYERSNCTDYNKSCQYAEDICAWYAMIKNNENLDIQISKNLPILWRQSSNSISNSKIYFDKKFQKAWNNDILQSKVLLKNDASHFTKIFIGRQIKHFKKTGSWEANKKIFDFLRYKFKEIDFIMGLSKNKKIEQEWADQISKNIKKESDHYAKIKQNAKIFLN